MERARARASTPGSGWQACWAQRVRCSVAHRQQVCPHHTTTTPPAPCLPAWFLLPAPAPVYTLHCSSSH